MKDHLHPIQIASLNQAEALAAEDREREEAERLVAEAQDIPNSPSEEKAVESFCANMTNAMADWFSNILTKSGFKFHTSYPEDQDETRKVLEYEYGEAGSLGLIFCANPPSIILAKRNQLWKDMPDWKIQFHLITPERIVLNAIESAKQL